MMYRIIPTARFRKEVKRAAKRGLPMERLEHVIDELAEGKMLAPQFRDHALTGDFAGYRECHVQPDWLLVYRIDKEILTLVLAYTGTHSNLF